VGQQGKQIGAMGILGMLVLAFALMICVFILLPLLLTYLVGLVIPAVAERSLLFNFVDGALRVVVFLLYLAVMRMFKDFRRFFQYHGAEHMSINAYEAHEELNLQNASKYGTLHARCGTSFLLVVMVLAMLVFSLIPQSSPLWVKFLSRIVLIPLIAGVSYEVIRFASKHSGNPLVDWMIRPGLWLQRITTKQPDRAQLEVALTALQRALAVEQSVGEEGIKVLFRLPWRPSGQARAA
jgi:uncharacterized protein YqhQ